MLIYEMLTLSLPGKPLISVSKLSPASPAWLDPIIERALAQDPAHRFATAATFLNAMRTTELVPAGDSDECPPGHHGFDPAEKVSPSPMRIVAGRAVSRLFSLVATGLFACSIFESLLLNIELHLGSEEFQLNVRDVIVVAAILSLGTVFVRSNGLRGFYQGFLSLGLPVFTVWLLMTRRIQPESNWNPWSPGLVFCLGGTLSLWCGNLTTAGKAGRRLLVGCTLVAAGAIIAALITNH